MIEVKIFKCCSSKDNVNKIQMQATEREKIIAYIWWKSCMWNTTVTMTVQSENIQLC